MTHLCILGIEPANETNVTAAVSVERNVANLLEFISRGI